MAPVPEDNKDIPSRDDSDNFFNPDLTIPVGNSDSDNSDDGEENLVAPGGYSLLPQEPDENGFDSDDNYIYSTENAGDTDHTSSFQTEASPGLAENPPFSALTESVLSSENGAVAPTVPASNSACHSAFLAKYPGGKIPSYMQVPRIPRDKEENLWNQQRQEPSKVTLDPVHESKILRAMSHFSLPAEHIPDWARDLTDDQWQQQVVSRIGITSARDDEHSTDAQHLTPANCGEESSVVKAVLVAENVWVAEFADDASNADTK